ncbi:MAG: esterase-like activity of phytase family protein, partial [Prochlorococcaceae cyanobacterium]
MFWNAEPPALFVKDWPVTLLTRSATILVALLASAPGARAAAGAVAAGGGAAALLPCPLEAGWRVERQLELPRRAADGREIGGFSAIQRDPATNQLLLLSDATEGALLRWSSLPARGTPRLLEVLPLQRPMDGEGLVVLDGQLWVASEGRRTPERAAQLLR